MTFERKPVRILFVCMGNICRSPAAEIVFRRMVDDAGLAGTIEIDSAGTIGYHVGNSPDARVADTLRARGYAIHGRARKVTATDLEDFDLVLPMDEDNEESLRQLCGDGESGEKIRPFVSFCTERLVPHVPDPYYGGSRGFEEVTDIVEDGCRGLLAHLRKRLGR